MPYLSSSPLQDRALQWYFLAAMGGLIVLTAVTVKVAKERPLYSNLAQGTTAVSRSLQVFLLSPAALLHHFSALLACDTAGPARVLCVGCSFCLGAPSACFGAVSRR